MERRRRILLVTRNFPPLTGGMERLMLHVYEELSQEYDVALVGPRGCRDYARDGAWVAEVAETPVWRFMQQIQREAHGLARNYRPELVFAGSGPVFPAAVRAAKVSAAPVGGYVHGLDLVYRSYAYRWFCLPAIRRATHVWANSTNSARAAAAVGVDERRISVLNPGVSVPTVLPDPAPFVDKLGLDGSKIILSVGRLTARKGLVEFVERCMPKIVRERRDACLVVVGDTPLGAAAHSANTRRMLQEAVNQHRLQEHVRLLGAVDEATLGHAYAAADVFVFPVLDLPGDIEGFGMVVLEASAHGVPSVAFNAGGVSDALRDEITGYLVEAGDYGIFSRRVLQCLNQPRRFLEDDCVAYARENSWERFGVRLRRTCREVVSRGTGPAA